ncbi:unnamed protein product [Tilletia caries]|nr:unnamed protein product [Tilletia caries]
MQILTTLVLVAFATSTALARPVPGGLWSTRFPIYGGRLADSYPGFPHKVTAATTTQITAPARILATSVLVAFTITTAFARPVPAATTGFKSKSGDGKLGPVKSHSIIATALDATPGTIQPRDPLPEPGVIWKFGDSTGKQSAPSGMYWTIGHKHILGPGPEITPDGPQRKGHQSNP